MPITSEMGFPGSGARISGSTADNTIGSRARRSYLASAAAALSSRAAPRFNRCLVRRFNTFPDTSSTGSATST